MRKGILGKVLGKLLVIRIVWGIVESPCRVLYGNLLLDGLFARQRGRLDTTGGEMGPEVRVRSEERAELLKVTQKWRRFVVVGQAAEHV